MIDRSKSGRRYDAQFKQDAVALVEGGRPYTRVAAELGISTTALKRWLDWSKTGRLQASEAASALSAEEHELRRLRRELAEVSLQRDILKKALAICSNTVPAPTPHSR